MVFDAEMIDQRQQRAHSSESRPAQEGRDHNAEKANTPISGKEPEFFVKTADCVVGPEEPIAFDERFSKKIDCEAELAVIIGKPGRFIDAANALDHVFGYTIVNDVTARDRQVRRTPEGMTWYELGSGKAFDSGAPLGPCIVTADEIGDPQNLKLQSRVNGELRQSSSTSNMIWNCAELIHFFSRNFTLKPGMALWREKLFAAMARNAGNAADYFNIPANRVIELGTRVEI